MRQLGWAILVLLVVHLLAVAGGVVWLARTDRLSQERVEAVLAMFRTPIGIELEESAKADAAAAEARAMAEQVAKLEAVSHGAQTLNDRLGLEEQKDELAMHRVERLKRETEDLRRQIERAQEILTEQHAELEAEREAFERFVEQTTARLQDEDFQRAVQTYEQLKPRQAKQMFRELLAGGQEDRVVQYLAAMQIRKSAAVLKEFRTPEEVAQATALLEALREQGVYVADERAIAGATP